ncbi:ATP-dependent DNA helicase [Rubellicoccus peritrichatus]|uniref:Helicase C-terminal domain-containing protein n=1 Tax=Rubellicoccus peritrichatus TaxID=3080537 RepID=A0AAQ3QW01_9BACT|nr:helicase C-terminal domain-containing protein [Puniceicoccus sp. CR14]WOO42138.1 helicase C-terminal domain-containing protein [Puniceicoccus sp. CR14]
MINFAEAPSGQSDPALDIVALTQQIFAEDGWLCSALELEHRPQQEAMALSSAAAFANNEPLLFEAGTGVGKSLAYLIPGILQSVVSKRPFLVSSHTIALQQQIEKKDLAICRHLFSRVEALKPFRDFKFSLLVGRGNYLCGHRLARAIETRVDLFGNAQSEELERIVDWVGQTKTGMREELRPSPSMEVWDWVNADSSACNRKHCTPETCFFRRAQAQRAEANVIIVNHSLLFSLIAAGLSPMGDSRGVLYTNDFLVLDEAHTIPDTATDHFGISVSSFAVERLLKRLYTHKGKKPRGLIAKIGRRDDQMAVLKALAEAEIFFNDISQRILRKNSVVRLHEANWASPQIARPFSDVIRRLKIMADDDGNKQVRDELRDQANQLHKYLIAIHECIELKEEGCVYWLERGGRKGQLTVLRSAPIEIAPELRTTLFERDTGVVLTSATLTSAGRMEAFQERTGAHGLESAVEASPFDYQSKLEIFISSDAPQPSASQGRLDLDYLSEMIRFCSLQVEGGTLVLFTSYSDLATVASALNEPMQKAGRLLLSQGGELSRSELKSDFIETGNAILLGTDSFWTGFDVPGPALSQVIMTRLPFDNPGDPIREARGEAIQQKGGQPFAEMTLPEAVIRFRQGVGRLIRSNSDCGILTLLDSRLLNKPYGKWFTESLPKHEFTVLNKKNRNEAFTPVAHRIFRK